MKLLTTDQARLLRTLLETALLANPLLVRDDGPSRLTQYDLEGFPWPIDEALLKEMNIVASRMPEPICLVFRSGQADVILYRKVDVEQVNHR